MSHSGTLGMFLSEQKMVQNPKFTRLSHLSSRYTYMLLNWVLSLSTQDKHSTKRSRQKTEYSFQHAPSLLFSLPPVPFIGYNSTNIL